MHIMKRLIPLLFSALILVGLKANATPVALQQSIPASGSTITTFDIQLKFDVSGAIAESGNQNVAIGYLGSYSRCAKLYDGDAETGTLLISTLGSSFYGSATSSQDCVNLGIPFSYVPQKGHKYTVVVTNTFGMYDRATGTLVSNSQLTCNNNPLVFEFYGADASANELRFEKGSIANGESVSTVSTISFTFSGDIAVAQEKPVQILLDDQLVASSKSIKVDPSNSKALLATFDDVNLMRGNKYTVSLPEGVVSLKSNTSATNKQVDFQVNGNSSILVPTVSLTPENNSVGLPRQARFVFDLDEKMTLHSSSAYVDVYKNEVSPANLLKNIRGTVSKDTLIFSMDAIRYEPQTKYIIHKKANDITVQIDGKNAPAYGNEEISISFTTPAVEATDFPPMEFGNEKYTALALQEEFKYTPDVKADYISTFKAPLVNQHYPIDGEDYYLCTHPDRNECYLYEVTDEGDKLIKTLSAGIGRNQYQLKIWYDLSVNVSTRLYEGRKYKLVIPAKTLTVSPKYGYEFAISASYSLCDYVYNDEMVFTFTGGTSKECVYLGCNVDDDAQVFSLYNIIWRFQDNYKLNEACTEKIKFETNVPPSSIVKVHPSYYTPEVHSGSGTTYVMIDFVSRVTGKPDYLNSEYTYTVTVPKGLIINTGNGETVNEEIVLNFSGADEDQDDVVKVTTAVEGGHSYTHTALYGKGYKFTVTPPENWLIESVKRNSTSLSPVSTEFGTNGANYELNALYNDVTINVTYKYAGKWAQENSSSGVWAVPSTDIRIYKDGESIVVEGVNPENTINVYTVGGTLVKTTTAPAGSDIVRLTVTPGQYYIIAVDGTAAKLKM